MLDNLTSKFNNIFKTISGNAKISEKNIDDAVEQIKLALLEADVNLRVVRRFINRTISDAKGETVLKSINPGQQFIKIVHDRMVQLLGDEKQNIELKGPDVPSVILMMGLQGSGKTTSSAKLALNLKKNGRRPLLVAADLVRPAAVKQLHILGEQIGVAVYSEKATSPVKVVKNALKKAKKEQYNAVIIDTAGRMNVDSELMSEIKAVSVAAAPDETLLVADSMTGQYAVDIAKEFEEKVGISGIILSKFDSDARGGAALSLKTITGKPIKFIGTGEKMDDIEPFYPERIASRILGMGDVVSLVEKVQENIEADDAKKLEEKMAKATFTLQDYLDQLKRVRKMGNMKSIIDMIPGAAGKISEDDINEKEIKHEEAIILSMTIQERTNHRIIGPSRRKRIALGSGTNVYEVNRLLKKFDKLKLMMKKMTKNKKYQAKLMSQFGGA